MTFDDLSIHEAYGLAKANLLRLPGVNGIGIGHSSLPHIKVYAECACSAHLIPDTIAGHKVELKITGPIRTLQTSYARPVGGGYSIGPANANEAGTNCGTVYDLTTKQPLFLSDFHVLSSRNNPGPTPILQPSLLDGASYPQSLLGTIRTLYPLNPGGNNIIDAGVCTPTNPSDLTSDVIGIGPVTSLKQISVGQRIIKSGRDGIAQGQVTDVNATFRIDGYTGLGGTLNFVDMAVVEPAIGVPGSSGSPVVETSSGSIVGKIVAGGTTITILDKATNISALLNVGWSPDAQPVVLSGGSYPSSLAKYAPLAAISVLAIAIPAIAISRAGHHRRRH